MYKTKYLEELFVKIKFALFSLLFAIFFSVNASADVYNIKTINLHKGKKLVEAKICGGTHLENSQDVSERSIEFSERGTDIFGEGKSVYIKFEGFENGVLPYEFSVASSDETLNLKCEKTKEPNIIKILIDKSSSKKAEKFIFKTKINYMPKAVCGKYGIKIIGGYQYSDNLFIGESNVDIEDFASLADKESFRTKNISFDGKKDTASDKNGIIYEKFGLFTDENGNLMVPVRNSLELINKNLAFVWNNEEKSLWNNNFNFKITVGEKKAVINGKNCFLENNPVIKNGILYVEFSDFAKLVGNGSIYNKTIKNGTLF